MDSWMGRYNSNARNRSFNRTLNGSNLNPTNMPANGTLSMIDLNLPYVSYGTEEDGFYLNEIGNYTRAGISVSATSSTVSDFVSGVRNTGLIPSETLPNNARSSLQMQNLWHAPTASSSQTTHFPGGSRITLVENSTHLTFSEQHTNVHGGSSSASRNQTNAFVQSSVTHMMMRDLPKSALRYQLINNIEPPQIHLVTGEGTVAVNNRERLLYAGDSFREPSHIDNPIVIEDEEEDEHRDGQQGVIFYDGDMSYEALLALQEHIGDVETGLNKNVIAELLMHRKYQSTKMNDCSDFCRVCLGIYRDGEELGKINCCHEFHYHCIKKWLKIKNSCPICKRTALTP